MKREDLILALDNKIYEEVEERLGTNINMALYVYKNLPALNSFTKSKSASYKNDYVYKSEIKKWLENIEDWIFAQMVSFERLIRFRESQRIK